MTVRSEGRNSDSDVRIDLWIGGIRYRKMFGKYFAYLDDKPLLLVCDHMVFVKKLAELTTMMEQAPCGYPYDVAKEYFEYCKS